MIERYVTKLIKNIPKSKSKNIEVIDIILDGGVFNGSYQIGALYFLKEMVSKKMLIIDKISACSVGTLCALTYYTNNLHLCTDLYTISIKYLKKYKNLNFLYTYIDEKIKPLLSPDIYLQLSNKLFITYYNVKKNKKIVKSKYKSNDELLQIIKRSCFIPFIMNSKLVFEKKYIDGINPYIMDHTKTSNKILYLDLFGYDKLNYLFSIKNEKTNYHRILSGILDIHLFFIKKSNTQMCSYVNDWGLFIWIKNHIIKQLIEKFLLYFIIVYINLQKYILWGINDSVYMKVVYKIIYEIYLQIIDSYCL